MWFVGKRRQPGEEMSECWEVDVVSCRVNEE